MDHFMYVFILCIKGTTFAYDDLSYNNAATQSHTFTGRNYGADNAVDENIMTCMRTNEIGRIAPYKTLLWKVDLGGPRNIYSINILFKNYIGLEKRQQGRFAGFSLYVSKTGDIQSSTLCYRNGPQLPPLNFTTICAEYERYVIYYNERIDGVSYPSTYETSNVYTELCEVSVKDIQMLRINMTSSVGWIVGLSVSIAVNIILIINIAVMCREKFRKKGSISSNLLSCWKITEFYQDTNDSIDETSTYQELAVPVSNPELTYHNTPLK